MEKIEIKAYRYRWVMLAIYMLIVAVNQLLWITFAPITSDSAIYFQVDDLQIGLLSMIFMVVFIVVSVPASWIIDTYGIRIGVGIGALFTGIFGMSRGLVNLHYEYILISQIGIAIGQPFLLNAITKIASRWFPLKERATASGLGTLSMYVGIMLGIILTPFLVKNNGIAQVLFTYGVVAALASLVFILFSKEYPPTASCLPEEEERSLAFKGLKDCLRNREFYVLLIIFFIGLGVFNSLTTWIEEILKPRGFSPTQAGVIGGTMIIGGIFGALVLPMLSDYLKKRLIFIKIALIGASIGLIGITFAESYGLVILSSILFGFFLLSSGPIGFQYGAEITFPASEGTSNGLLLLVGQISGIAFIIALDSLKNTDTGSMTYPLLALIVLMLLSILLSLWLKESPMMKTKENSYDIK